MHVLVLNTVCCWRKSNEPFVALGQQLARRGIKTTHLVGGGDVCSFYGTLQDWTDEKCEGTQARVAGDIRSAGNAARNLRSFVTPEMRARVDAWWAGAQELPPDARSYGGLRIRNIIRGSLSRQLARPLHPDPDAPGGEEAGDAREKAFAQQMAYAAALTIEIAECALRELRPDAVLLFNGYFYVEWIFSAVAKRMGIRTVAHEAACFADRMYFDPAGQIGNRHFMSSQAVVHAMEEREFGEAEAARLRAYLKDVYEGRVNNIAQAATEDLDALRVRLRLPRGKRIVLQIGQVSYDTVVIYDAGMFPTALDYVRAGIAAAAGRADCHLVLRLHPHEVAVNNNWTLRQIASWELPDNVTVVHSHEANTYQLMELADCGIALTSQAGLEMSAFGKPVAVCGNAFYKGKGFTYDAASPAQLAEALDRALAAGGRLPETMQARLDRYLSYHLFDYLIPFDPQSNSFGEDAADRIVRVLDPVAAGRSTAPAAPAPAPVDLVQHGGFAQGIAGWLGHGARIARVACADADSGFALECRTDRGAYSGALFGCRKANACDGETLRCAAGARHTVSVQVRGVEQYDGVPVQLHVIDDKGATLGSAHAALTGAWQELRAAVRTSGASAALGVQIVKRNHTAPAAFLVRGLEAIAHEGGAGAAVPGAAAFPRVLIVSEVPFGNHTGYGVTISNLFRGWPKDRLAQAYRTADYEPDHGVCGESLRLYDSSQDPELRGRSLLQRYLTKRRKMRRGELDTDSGGHRASAARAIAWSRPFKPDVVFVSPVTYATARLATDLSAALGVPYVCHIMDDWLAQWEAGRRPECKSRREPLNRMLRNRIAARLFRGAARRQVISQEMASAYKARYGYGFEVVHNAVDLSAWDLGERASYAAGDPFRIVYTGAIWWNIQMPTLRIVAEAVADLAAEGHALRLDIHTHANFENRYAKELPASPAVQFRGLVPYAEMPRLMREADALLAPVTFDPDLLLFSQYSMPTKLPEYMISGTPVILCGPAEATPVAHALRKEWGVPVCSEDKAAIKSAIVKLMSDEALRRSAGEQARRVALEDFDLRRMRESFWDSLRAAAAR